MLDFISSTPEIPIFQRYSNLHSFLADEERQDPEDSRELEEILSQHSSHSRSRAGSTCNDYRHKNSTGRRSGKPSGQGSSSVASVGSNSYVDTDADDYSPGTPQWKKWSESLDDLLADSIGHDLFREYLAEEKAEPVLLFYLACNGLKKEKSAEKRTQLINIIYRVFVKQQSALTLLPETKSKLDTAFLMASQSQTPLSEQSGIFDEAQMEAWKVMESDLYPNFIISEKYQFYVNAMQVSL